MVEKSNIVSLKRFIVATKITPILIAIIHFINTIISFIGINDIPLNYIGGISLIPIIYLYIASYTFHFCEYHRLFLHYSVIINLINCYDFYVGIPINDRDYMIGFVGVTLITMFILIYLKFIRK